MNDREIRRRIHHAMDARLSGMTGDPWLAQRILYHTGGDKKVKKKISVGLVCVLILVIAAVTALAVGLTHYFGGFADLEATYGEYAQWPASAKVQLVELMLDSGVLSPEHQSQWSDTLPQTEKEAAAEAMLADYFSGMVYVDTYNAMVRELGPIEQWTDEQRALYTSLLEKHGRLTDSWPVYQLPNDGELSREAAIARARQAVLDMFSISAEEVDALAIDASFSSDAYNAYGLPADEPFWTVSFGYGYAYWITMSRFGEIVCLSGPETPLIHWGRGVMDGSVAAAPGVHDATRAQAIQNAHGALTEIMNVSPDAVETMDATAYFLYSDLYAHGDEPVWLVIWSQSGEAQYQVLLGYDASYIDAEPTGKLFDHVVRNEVSLSDLCSERYAEVGIENPLTGASGSYYGWTLEEKAAFYLAFADFVNEYARTHPYMNGQGCMEWLWTRNASALPDESVLTQADAEAIARSALEQSYGEWAHTDILNVFYYVTTPDRPEWRFVNPFCGIALDAHTGEVLLQQQAVPGEVDFDISTFLAEII